MVFLDLTAELLRKVDFERSEITQPRKLVFVCGGKASNVIDAPASLRELLLNRASLIDGVGSFGGSDVLLAEEAMNALASSSFNNLLDLEEYIAAVVHAVILIVESPGSMCELGAFVKTVEIREKLIVVLPGEHKNVPSFITKGAVEYLKENDPSAQILGFHWTSANGIVSAQDYALDSMMKDIPEAMGQVHKVHAKEGFDKEKLGHIIYLALSFCHLLRASKLTDLKFCFLSADIVMSEVEIKRCLDTLLICKLVKAVEHGRLTYYVARVERMPLEIAFKRDTPDRDRDSLRIVARVRAAIQEEEPFRLSMFRDHHDG